MDPRPNPSWAGFTVDYVLPHAAPTTIEIFDPSGRQVRVLAPTRVMPPARTPRPGTVGARTASGCTRASTGSRSRPERSAPLEEPS